MKNKHDENENLLAIAESYYQHLLAKDFLAMEAYLDEDVALIGPLSSFAGKAAVVEAAKGLSRVLERIDIRAKFQAGSQIMLAYDFFFPAPIGKLRSAVLMEFRKKPDFKNERIFKIELFFDTKPFQPNA